jgi:glyoxylase-like metal-dependent hydrolase (beta-lactamase superfamily II)
MGKVSANAGEARVTVIQTGSTLVSPAVPNRASRRMSFAYTGLFQRRSSRIEVPVKAFLVEVGGHRVLVDTGWSEQCVEHALSHMGFSLWFASEPVVAPGEGMGPQLKRLGLTPQQLDAVVLTHMDCDHASGLVDLEGAPHVIASAEEIEAAGRRDVRYRPAFWKGVSIEAVSFTPMEAAPFGRGCDLFGDGTVELVFTPGHTAGSLAVIARNPASGRFALLAGDTGYNAASWDELRLPGPLVDAEKMRHSLAWVRGQRGRDNCAGVLAAHDPDPALKGGAVLSF